MKRLAAVIVAVVLTAVAGAVLLDPGPTPPPAGHTDAVTDSTLAAPGFDSTAADRERIRALEQAVSDERAARQLLEDQLFALIEEVDRLSRREDVRRAATVESGTEPQPAEISSRALSFLPGARNPAVTERRTAALVAAGFAADEAARILRRESELRMQAMQARFEARIGGEPIDPFDPQIDPRTMLRDELGDAQYERYLEANNRPTSIAINSILESSPAQAAGLMPGDRIVSYDGRRVFNVGDLNRQTVQGTPGENVVVDIVRDGTPMQVVLPRGPLGVMAGRAR